MDLLLIALATFAFVEFAKVTLPVVFHDWVKMLFALAVAWTIALVLSAEGWDDAEAWVTGLAAAGLAGLAQKVHRLLSAVGDAQQVAVMMKATRQGRRL